jgi:N-acetylneuraminic acid mutarotase
MNPRLVSSTLSLMLLVLIVGSAGPTSAVGALAVDTSGEPVEHLGGAFKRLTVHGDSAYVDIGSRPMTQNAADLNQADNLSTARALHTATLLSNGLVLVAGGVSSREGNSDVLASAELYEPQTGHWHATGSLQTARSRHTATLLHDGRVLVVGGDFGGASAELYDPVTEIFTSTGSLSVQRIGHTATLLPNGQVLVAGGMLDYGTPTGLASAELYDPNTGIWHPAGDLLLGRHDHTATLLGNGQILVAGGNTYADDQTNSAELFNPTTGVFTSTASLAIGRFLHGTVPLTSGQVLVIAGTAGAASSHFGPLNEAETYDPTAGQWRSVGSLTTPRFGGFTATPYPDGTVFVAGGYGYGTNAFVAFDSVERYDPSTEQWETVKPLQVPRYNHTATLLEDGSILLVGGYAQYSSETPLASVERYLFVYRQYVPFLTAPDI